MLLTLALAGTIAVDDAAPAEPPAPESTAKATVLGEIIVTARRTNENLQDVPIAISVIDEQALAKQVITNGNDLSQASPGLSSVNSFGRNNTSYSIRGKGEAFGGSAPGVIAYYAEVPDFSPMFYDLSSIQVLKGPQGTLFGRNTIGGAILLTPKKPGDTYEGYALARAGNYSRFDRELAYGGPLIDDVLFFRIAGQQLRRDGYTRDLSDGDRLDDEDRDSARLSLVWQPLEGIENYTLVQYDHVAETGTGSVISAFADIGTTPNREELRAYIPIQEARGPRKVEHDGPDNNPPATQWGVINTASWQMTEAFLLKGIIRYSWGDDRSLLTNMDADGSPFRNIHNRMIEFNDKDLRNAEVQLLYDDHDTLRGVVGLYSEDNEYSQGRSIAEISAPPSAGELDVPLEVPVTDKRHDLSNAAFVQATWNFLPHWNATLGWRHTRDTRKRSMAAGLGPPGLPLPLLPYQDFELKSSENTWNVALDYEVTDDLLTYLTVRRGYKAGGFNLNTNPDDIPYFPEFVVSYEAGAKSEWQLASVGVRANVDVFYDDYTDMQRYVSPVNPIGGYLVTNASKASILGTDIDLLVAPSDWFDASIQYTLLKTKYQEYLDPSYGDLTDSQFVNAPKHQVMFTPSLHGALPGRWGTLSLGVPVYYQSDFAISVNNVENGVPANDRAVPASNKPGYTRIDVRLDWQDILALPLSLALYARNIDDKVYEVGGYHQLGNALVGTGTSVYAAPRMISLELKYEFR